MDTISASDARQTLPALLDRVEAGEDLAISRHGRVIAVLVKPERLRSRRAADAWKVADDLGQRLEAARSQPLSVEPALSHEYAEELIDWIRDGRDAR
ncbi:MAG: type II toxin-antitoxin system Phd/YefM family antitoxin [Actinobacteria bacterium]|nr:type II toxin-antitoxin system Phd/YefM family antitoxin [Actinomycetota bacterium]